MAASDLATAPRTRQSRTGAPAQAPRRTQAYRPHVPHNKAHGRLGSQQVVSVRGRRVAAPVKEKNPVTAVGGLAVALLVVGIAIAMILSGVATAQTFTIQRLQSQERMLENEVESLNRDLEDRRSSAEIAQRAAKEGMLIASQPGIVEVGDDGRIEERRGFNPESLQPVGDINGAPSRADRATSDERATDELADSLTQVPGGNVIGDDAPVAPRVENLAPYQPNVPAAF